MRIFLKGGSWTNAEDQSLLALVQKVGLNRWASISTTIGHKSPEQCQQRWVEFLDPAINKGEWTREETRKLLQCYEIFPDQWQSIASQLSGRRPWQCQERYSYIRSQGLGFDDDKPNLAADDGGVDGETILSGDYKLYHEMRAAKADTVDGDEYNAQVTEFTRSRLANQKGKKQLRKEKHEMLAQTKLLTTLERKREMEAAGIETHTQKKAFRRAVEEDQRGRKLAGDAEEDDNAVTADLADVMGSNAYLRQAASHKKTVLVADDRVMGANSNRKESGAALIPGFEAYSIGSNQATSAHSALGSYSSAESKSITAAGPALVGDSAASPAMASRPLLTQNNDALNALMARYLVGSGAQRKELVPVATNAAAQPLTNELGFDDISAPTHTATTKAPVADDDDDIFADLAPVTAPSALYIANVQPPTPTSTIEEAGAAVGEEKEETEEDEEEEDEEGDKPSNSIYRALDLLRHESRIHWEAKGDWQSEAQSTTYLHKARELIANELASVMDPLGQYTSTNKSKNEDDANDHVQEELPPLMHPKVLDLMRNYSQSVAYPSEAEVLEDAIELEAVTATAAQALGLKPTTSSRLVPVSIDDAPSIVAAKQLILEESAKLAEATDILRSYEMAFGIEMGEVFRRRLNLRGRQLQPFKAASLVQPNTKRPRDGDEIPGHRPAPSSVLDQLKASYSHA